MDIMIFFRERLSGPLSSVMPLHNSHWSLQFYIDLALKLSGSAFTVREAEEDSPPEFYFWRGQCATGSAGQRAYLRYAEGGESCVCTNQQPRASMQDAHQPRDSLQDRRQP